MLRFLLVCFGLGFFPYFKPQPFSLPFQAKVVHDFKLRNTDGKNISLSDFPSAKGFIIVFTCNHCPFAKLYPDRLNKLNAKYQSLNVPLIAINSIDSLAFEEETLQRMQNVARQNQFSFPYLQDVTQSVAKDFGAEKTPHAFVIWKEDGKWMTRYSGAIDDNGAEPDKVKHPYVEEAVDALLNNIFVKEPITRSVGCAIQYRKN